MTEGDAEVKETLALLELLVIGNRDITAGRTRPLSEVVARFRRRRAAR